MGIPYKIIELDTIDSTNDYAKRLLSSTEHFTIISARNQTFGRGQRGNVWKSNTGENLLFSIVLKFGANDFNLEIPASSQMAISCITALSVVNVLESLHIKAKIKWPNDVYIGDRKVCGILIENSINGSFLASSIVGVGINVNQIDFDDDIPNPISIAQSCGSRQNTEYILHVFLNEFDRLLNQFASCRIDYDRLREIYVDHLWQLNTVRDFIDRRSYPEESFTGMIRGILPDGRLLIETAGKTRRFAFNEVSYFRIDNL